MDNFSATWAKLDSRRRVVVILATIGVFAAVLFLTRQATAPGMSLLYAGLDQSAASEVVTALDQRGVAYEVRGAAIYVESGERDSLRLTLAGEGLPAASGPGYELLDGLSGFGTTAQMFDAAYWRAKEGELARTILASPQFRSARVHIANPSSSGFSRGPEATASVFVAPSSGGISPAQAKALRYLVASAVRGLEPERVSVIDSESGAVIVGEELTGSAADSGEVSERLRDNVRRLLEARVGPGNAVVEVSVTTETERESIVERRFDPEGRVAISSVTEESSGTSEGQGGGAVTVASNLPDGDANAGGNSSSSQNTQTREQLNFEVSETQRELVRAPGAIKKLSVAVLVNGIKETDANGVETWTPRAEEELSALRELVSSAVGYEEDRGDTITIKSLAFESVPEMGTGATLSVIDRLGLDFMHLISMAVLALVALGLGMFVVRPILTAKAPPERPALPVQEAPPPPVEPESSGALTGEIADNDIDLSQMSVVTDFGGDDPGGLPDIGVPSAGGVSSDPVARLKQMIDERQDETMEILQSWVETPKESA